VWSNLGQMTADRPPTTYVYRDDLPNEDGIPNHDYDLDGTIDDDDNHDFLTGSGVDGRKSTDDTLATRCNDWTSLSPGSSGTGTGGRRGGMGSGNGPGAGTPGHAKEVELTGSTPFARAAAAPASTCGKPARPPPRASDRAAGTAGSTALPPRPDH